MLYRYVKVWKDLFPGSNPLKELLRDPAWVKVEEPDPYVLRQCAFQLIDEIDERIFPI